MDARPDIAVHFQHFGTPAVVTVPGGPTVAATVMDCGKRPLRYLADDGLVVGAGVQHVAFNRYEVPEVPPGTTFTATIANTWKEWTVDRVAEEDEERVIVVVR